MLVHIKFVCIDVANGYLERFVEFVKQFRELFLTLLLLLAMLLQQTPTQELIPMEQILLRWALVLVVFVLLQTGVDIPTH